MTKSQKMIKNSLQESVENDFTIEFIYLYMLHQKLARTNQA